MKSCFTQAEFDEIIFFFKVLENDEMQTCLSIELQKQIYSMFSVIMSKWLFNELFKKTDSLNQAESFVYLKIVKNK